MAVKNEDEDAKPSRLKIITTLGYALAAVIFGFTFTAIQGNAARLDQLEQELQRFEADVLARLDDLEDELVLDVQQLEAALESEIARLDESNRNRRDSIAELQVSTSANQTALDELRRDIERLLPFGSDSP